MNEYIKREEAIEAMKHAWAKGLEPSQYLEIIPAANVAPVQEWISVEDRLPEIGRCVIAYNALAKCAAEAMYKGEGMFLQFRWPARLQEHEITHWMPLPEPPKGE